MAMPRDEKASDEPLKPQAKTDARIPPTHGHARRTENVEPSSAKRPLATHPGLARRIIAVTPRPAPLKQTEAFGAVYRLGRWARGAALSVGALPTHGVSTRVGLRTRRGLTGAVERNRLKRQLRAIIYAHAFPFRSGFDVVVVIHPQGARARSEALKRELITLCKKAGVSALDT